MSYIPTNDLDGIKNGEDHWPHWPFLPMKRIEGSAIRCGVVNARDKACVVEVNLYDLGNYDRARCYLYASIEAMLADGWVVD